MECDFVFEPKPGGLVVQTAGSRAIPVSEWTARAARSLGAGTLIRLRDDGRAVENDNGRSLMVSWQSVAGLTTEELQYIGLPDAAPFALEVVASGAIHNTGFRIQYGFIGKGRRVLGVQRQGAWLCVGEEEFVLVDPLHEIADAIDRFDRSEAAHLESRMLEWGRIAEMLPPDAVVDDHLRTLNIVVASTFELDPFVNHDGEPDFDPVVGRRQTRVAKPECEEQVFVRSLPDAQQREFALRFRELSRVKHRYGLGGDSYVVLTPEVERALGAVHRAQAGTAEERRAFLRNVSGYLRGAFDRAGQAAVDVDSVFSDDGLSDRVLGVGIWVEKALPWIKVAAEPWLPPEELGLRIGSRLVRLVPDDLPGLLEEVHAAINRGDLTVQAGEDIEIPADVTTIRNLEELIRRSQPIQHPRPECGPHEPPSDPVGLHGSGQVLLIVDNLEAIQFLRERKNRAPGVSTVTPALRSRLLPHQRQCLAWLQRHWAAGSCGALLADDMGLGKTLEALAFLSCLKANAVAKGIDHRPMLVVAPTGLLQNWLDEHEKHLPEPGLGRAIEAHGTELRRLRTDTRAPGNELGSDPPLPKLDIEALKRAEWVLTTYENMRDYQHSFGRVRWQAAVFDEAQKIKNPRARVTDAALAMNVDFALLMTGTPVENRPADIWSMLDRAEPGMFGTLKDFSQQYETPDENRESALKDLHGKLTAESAAPALMLRRLKENHLSRLPNKQVHRYVVDMPGLQAERYEEVVLQSQQDGGMLQTLHHLRSISLHPFMPGDLDTNRYISESARLAEAFSILERVKDRGEKTLLFVESRQMQDFLIGAFRRRFQLPDDVLVINGAVSGKTRKARVNTFQRRKGFDIMILSPRAGGVGLTLTAANHVVHLSRWWNPAVEDQCTDRVFRIGQKRTVHVYLPLARHPRFGEYSFDLKLDSLLERKRDLNRRVLAPTAAADEDITSLFRSTTTEARSATAMSEAPEDGINIDLLEPTKFEEWVLRQLSVAGYLTRRTPRSGDHGADGLAEWRDGAERHTIVVQCKHTQSDSKCGRAAVEEVLNSVARYEILGAAKPMVVTNAVGFTADAQRLARQKNVRLVDRHNLSELRTWSGTCNPHAH